MAMFLKHTISLMLLSMVIGASYHGWMIMSWIMMMMVMMVMMLEMRKEEVASILAEHAALEATAMDAI